MSEAERWLSLEKAYGALCSRWTLAPLLSISISTAHGGHILKEKNHGSEESDEETQESHGPETNQATYGTPRSVTLYRVGPRSLE